MAHQAACNASSSCSLKLNIYICNLLPTNIHTDGCLQKIHVHISKKLKLTPILGRQQSDYQTPQVYSLQPSPYSHDKLAPAVPTEIAHYVRLTTNSNAIMCHQCILSINIPLWRCFTVAGLKLWNTLRWTYISCEQFQCLFKTFVREWDCSGMSALWLITKLYLLKLSSVLTYLLT